VSDSSVIGHQLALDVDRVATGGRSLGLGPDGRVVFVAGAIPGERVLATVEAEYPRRLEAIADEVITGSPDRIDPSCPNVARGCGGCDWQHIGSDRQSMLRRAIVVDCLRRLARIDAFDVSTTAGKQPTVGGDSPGVPVRPGPTLASAGYRTTVRVAVVDGCAGYRKRSAHEVVDVEQCAISHPMVESVLAEGRFGSAREVTIRVGAATGERMVVVTPTADGVTVPDDVIAVGADELAAGRRPHIHEVVGGIRFQISAGSFFQCRPDGALALGQVVSDALSEVEGTMLDAYCGVGLFGALCGTGRRVVGVESSSSAAADAGINLGPHAEVVENRFERWKPQPVAVAVADPARSGLRAGGADRLARTGAEIIALVSCDPASLARDARLLLDRGYELNAVTVVDLFGQTSHVETVSQFRRRPRAPKGPVIG
jgi:23S rRNA (uracil1939-C5)-methyltransferase